MIINTGFPQFVAMGGNYLRLSYDSKKNKLFYYHDFKGWCLDFRVDVTGNLKTLNNKISLSNCKLTPISKEKWLTRNKDCAPKYFEIYGFDLNYSKPNLENIIINKNFKYLLIG